MAQFQDDLQRIVRTERSDYTKGVLDESQVDKDPFKQFSGWLGEEMARGNGNANAMVLSTADAEGMPSSRVVLLRDLNEGGFTFFTNYESTKGKQLRENPKASLLFFWPDQERQVRVQGRVEVLPEKELLCDEFVIILSSERIKSGQSRPENEICKPLRNQVG